ncbi:MAG: T9SS type A sorting domain-containing protein [Bacteroidota bacterium]
MTDGAITTTVTGQTGQFNCSWTGPNGFASNNCSISNLAPGTYNLTITDQFPCTFTTSVVIADPAPVSATITAFSHPDCWYSQFGSATAQGFGGTPPYSYEWSNMETTPTATQLPVGFSTVTVTDANMCPVAITGIILQRPPAIAISGTIDHPSCAGMQDGSISATVIGGTPIGPAPNNYDYLWTPSGQTTATATGLGAGSHILTVTDANGCQWGQSFLLEDPDPINVVFISASTPTCNGGSDGSLTAFATGGDGNYTYLWYAPGFIGSGQTMGGLSAGQVTCVVRDGQGCFGSAMINMTEPTAITANQAELDPTCGMANGVAWVVPSGGTPSQAGIPGYTYLWNTGAQTFYIVNVPEGIYTVTVTDAVGCSEQFTFNLDDGCKRNGTEAEGVEEVGQGALDVFGAAQGASLKAWPNPFSDKAQVAFRLGHDAQVQLEVFDLQGVKLATLYEGAAEANQQYEVVFDGRELADGIYIARLVDDQGHVATQKLLLNR